MRRLRAALSEARIFGATVFAAPERLVEPQAFRVLLSATKHFERRCFAEGVAGLGSLPVPALVDLARRHRVDGLLVKWIDEAANAGVAVPSDLREALRKSRWLNALQSARVLSCARDVRDRLAAVDVPCVFLKGGARLVSGELDADLQYSSDLDVLVPRTAIEPALGALHAAGYRELFDAARRKQYLGRHHRAPLGSPNVDVPVEVHIALTPLVSERLDYERLEPHLRRVDGPIGDVTILDPVGAALHLAYHTRDLSVLRDVVLLSRLLRSFDGDARAQFDAFVSAERLDGIRLASAAAIADAITSDVRSALGTVNRYLFWATLREDLPRHLRNDVVEAILARMLVKNLRLDQGRTLVVWTRTWLKNVALLPFVVRVMNAKRARR